MYSIADFDLTNIIHRQDGSYVATVKSSGVPYHIASDIDGHRHLLSSFLGYASAHPECVTEEQPRGISLPDLVERVLAKADAFAVASGSIIGQRQALEDRLDACTTLEEVQGITVDISMPGGGEA